MATKQSAVSEPVAAPSPDGRLSGVFEVNGTSFEIEFVFKNMAGNVLASRINKADITRSIEEALQTKFGLYTVFAK